MWIALVVAVVTLVVAGIFGEASADRLDGTSWVLSHSSHAGDVDGTAVASGSAPTAEFGHGTVNGTTGCNSYFGDYATDGASISIDAMGMTEIACEPEISDLEGTFVTLMSSATNYANAGDFLTITGPDGELGFRAA